MNDTRQHLHCLIRLGLWDHAIMYANQFVCDFDIKRDKQEKVIIRWHNRYFENGTGEKCYYPLKVLWR